MDESRALLVFENAIKSDETKKIYIYWLGKFKEHLKVSSEDDLLKFDPKELQIKLEDYAMQLKKHYSKSTIESIFYSIELFYSMNDVILNFKKIRKFFPEGKKRAGQEAYTTEDVRKILDSAKSRKTRALIHILASSGMRVGAVEGLKIKHFTDRSYGCRAVLVYAGSKEEYTTFITPEASKALNDYLEERRKTGEKLTGDSPLFSTFYRGKCAMSYQAVRTLLHRTVNEAHIEHVIENKRYTIPVAHGFRKRFNTILKSNNNINSNLVEKMMGHSTSIKLDNNYLKPSVDRLFDEYSKGIIDLTISDEERAKIQLKEQTEKVGLEKQRSDFIAHDLTRAIIELGESDPEFVKTFLDRVSQYAKPYPKNLLD